MKHRLLTPLICSGLVLTLPLALPGKDKEPPAKPKAGSGETKFSSKPAWHGTKDTVEFSGAVSASPDATGQQKVTLNPQLSADSGPIAVGVGAQVDISSLPPDKKDKWVNKDSLGGFKAEAVPEASVTVRTLYGEANFTKSAPDKAVSGDVRFNARENKAYWGNTVKGAVAVADDDDAAFAAKADKPAPAQQSNIPRSKDANEAIATYNKNQLELAKLTGKEPKLMEPLPVQPGGAPAAPAAPAAPTGGSGEITVHKPAQMDNATWRQYAEAIKKMFGGHPQASNLQDHGDRVSFRYKGMTEQELSNLERQFPNFFSIRRDAVPMPAKP